MLNSIKDYFEQSDLLCEGVLTFGEAISRIEDFTLDFSAHTVSCNNKPVMLTRNKFDLLLYLLNNKNRVVSKQAIAFFFMYSWSWRFGNLSEQTGF